MTENLSSTLLLQNKLTARIERGEIPAVRACLASVIRGRPAFIGISVGATVSFSKNVLRKYCAALDGITPDFLILVADSLEAYNCESKGLTPDLAAERAIRIGAQFARGYAKLQVAYPFVRVMPVSEFFGSAAVQSRLQTLQQRVFDDASFREDVERQVRENRPRQGRRTLMINDLRYILAEYAVMLALYDNLLQIDPLQISPNDDKVLRNIMSGAYKGLLQDLGSKFADLHYIVLDFLARS